MVLFLHIFSFLFLLFCDEKKERGWITERMSLGWMDGQGQIHLTKYVLCQWFDCSHGETGTEMSSAQKETLMNTAERLRLQCVIQQRAYLHSSPIPCKIYLNLIFVMLLSLWGYFPLAFMTPWLSNPWNVSSYVQSLLWDFSGLCLCFAITLRDTCIIAIVLLCHFSLYSRSM